MKSDVREWQPTVLKMNLTGKALMVKTVDIQIDEVASGFAVGAGGDGVSRGDCDAEEAAGDVSGAEVIRR